MYINIGIKHKISERRKNDGLVLFFFNCRNSFKIFKPSFKNSISNEIINDIVEDSSGKLWIATMEGLNSYDPEKDKWQNIMPSKPGSPKTLPNFLVWSLSIQNNLLWIASDVFDFASYDLNTKKFTHYDWQAYTRRAFPTMEKKYRSIQRITCKSDHEFWIASNIGLFLFDSGTGDFSYIGNEYNSDVADLAYDPAAKTVYLSTQGNDVFCYNELSKKYLPVKLTIQPYPSVSFDNKRDLYKSFHISTTFGLGEITGAATASVLNHIPQLSSSILPGAINRVYKDNNGIQWIATGNGINKLDINTATVFVPLLASSDKDVYNNMGPVVYDETENKYFICGQTTEELFILDGSSGSIQSLKAIDGEKLFGSVSIRIDHGKNIWLLTETRVYLFNRLLKKFEVFKTPTGNNMVTFRDVIRDANGDYWFVAFNGGLFHYDVAAKQFVDKAAIDSIMFVATSSLSDTIHRTVWIGTYGYGLFRYDLDTKKYTSYLETDKNPEYLQLNLINDMYQDPNGKIWITTYSGGLYVYEHGKTYEKSFRHLTMKTGLSNNSYSAINGKGENIWMLAGNGLSIIDTSGKWLEDVSKEKLMSFANYVSDSHYPHYMFFNERNNELLVAAGGGLIFYYPDQKTTVGDFPVVITDIRLDNNSLIGDSTFKPGNVFEIPYHNNTLSIDFAGLRYSDNAAIQYEYQLLGAGNNWINAGNQHSIKFSNLQPGTYTLSIKTRNAEGNINPSIAQFRFHVTPPFWKRWWFACIVGLLIAYILYKWNYSLREKIRSERILNYFATSLYGQNTVEDVFWDIAKNCMSQLKFEDCVIYQYDKDRKVLIQKAAYGPKNPLRFEILNNIEIEVGKGIVGTVAKTGKAEIINDTSKDSRYIVDDETRLSEITVPIIIDGKVFGIIDSEHSRKNFYKKRDLILLQKIADTCSSKISKYLIEDKLRSKIARDLHDELGSNLTSINIISKVALQQTDNAQVSTQLQKIKDHSGKMMESMSDIVWAINPANDTAEKMMLRIKEHTAEMLEPAKINFFFYEEGALTDTRLGLNERKDVFLIFKEALNNAVKYSEATEINIWLKKEVGSFVLIIADHGRGFDFDSVVKGNGLHNIQSRAAAMNAVVKITSVPGSGTSISLALPLT